jgi:DNA repair photolyase
MVISVSRRTDIPNYYSDWFIKRVQEGFVEVKNPMYPERKSSIDLSVEAVDCFVFWTKNPKNMLKHLDALSQYHYYFQFTLNGYGADIEPGIPDKEDVISTFKALSEKIGSEKVIWRYDPIFINDTYSIKYHTDKFTELATELKGFTNTVVISFIDLYGHAERNMLPFNLKDISVKDMHYIASEFVKIASENGMKVVSCAEKIDLKEDGVEHGCCIDQYLIEKIIGYQLKGGKDRNQRPECGCFKSRDIGVYNTCLNGCKYCYANYSSGSVKQNINHYDINSKNLC